MRRNGMGSHTKPIVGDSVVWLTPPDLLEYLGDFDLDPCAAPQPRPWDTAKTHYDITAGQDGLTLPWSGRAWCNPPYNLDIDKWLQRMAEHKSGIALIFARTETAAWHKWIWPHAHSVLFLSGRLYFHKPDGTRGTMNAGGPSALISYSSADTEHLHRLCDNSVFTGALVDGWRCDARHS